MYLRDVVPEGLLKVKARTSRATARAVEALIVMIRDAVAQGVTTGR